MLPVMKYRRQFDDAKRQGAQTEHLQDLDSMIENYLEGRLRQRSDAELKLRNARKTLVPSVDVPKLEEEIARLSAEIQELKDVRRDIAAELTKLDS